MYRVTALKNGVNTTDVEEFSDEESVIRAMKAAAPAEYVHTLRHWLNGNTSIPLVIKESSVWSDVWEYIP